MHKQKEQKTSGKGSVALLKKAKHLGCVFQDTEPPKSKSIVRNGKKSLGPKRSVLFFFFSQRVRYNTLKNRERKGPSQGVIHTCELQWRSPSAPQFEDTTQEENLATRTQKYHEAQGNGQKLLLLVGTRRTLQGTPLRRCSTSRDGVRLGKTHSTAQWTGEDSSTSRYVAWQYKNG